METIPTSQAERQLSELIHRASAGENIVLEAPSGERVRLEPIDSVQADRVPGLMKGFIGVPARLFEPIDEEELRLWYGEDG